MNNIDSDDLKQAQYIMLEGLGRHIDRFIDETKYVPAITPTSLYDNDKKKVEKFMKTALLNMAMMITILF